MPYTADSLVREIARMDPDAPDYEETLRTLIGEAQAVVQAGAGSRTYTVIGLVDDEAPELYVAAVLEGHLTAVDTHALERACAFTLSRYALHVEAGTPDEAEAMARAEIARAEIARGAIAGLRGCMADGYGPERVNRVLGAISAATGLELVCVWHHHDDCAGPGGHSEFHVKGNDGSLRELAGDLWPWLSGDPSDPATPATPGNPDTWAGEALPFTAEDLPWHDRLRNYAHGDQP